MSQDIVYNYIDGNGNKFIINRDSIEYFPIKPVYSSSGIYDGGKHVIKKISYIQYDVLLSAIHNGLKNIENHIKDRVKGSGLIIVNKANIQKIKILAPQSNSQIEIEKILDEIIKF